MSLEHGVLRFRYAQIAPDWADSLQLAWWNAWITMWRDIAIEYDAKKGWVIVDGVRYKCGVDDGWAGDAPGRDIGGTAADTGGTGD